MPERTATEKRKAINARAWKWDQAHTKQFKIKLNENTDAEIISWLESQPNMQGYLKNLIRADIAAHATSENHFESEKESENNDAV